MIRNGLALLLALAATLLVPALASAAVTDEGFESGLGAFRSAGTGAVGSNFAQVNTDKHSGTFSAFAPDPNNISDRQLTNDLAVTVPSSAPAPRLSFWHRFVLESGFDGGVLEVSVDAAPYAAVPDSRFLATPPNATISSGFGSPIAGRRAWSGNSGGFVQSVVDLSAYAGHKVAFRFRLGSDQTLSATGWWVDDVSVSGLASDGSVTQTGAIATSDPTQAGRLTRNGVVSDCTASKAYPGAPDATPRHFDLPGFVNRNSEPACVTVKLESTTCPTGLFPSTYSTPYNPANLATGYLADAGASGATATQSASIPAGGHFQVDVVEVNANTGCASYDLTVSSPPPETSFSSGPQGSQTSRSASFGLASTAAGSSFQCSLDGAAYSTCGSPAALSNLSVGNHTFSARATDPNTATDPTPASRSFSVTAPDTLAPGVSALGLSPKRFHTKKGAKVSTTVSEASTATFRIDRAGSGRRVKGKCVKPTKKNHKAKRCTRYSRLKGSIIKALPAGKSGFKFTKLRGKRLKPGSYRMVVTAKDAAGNVSKSRSAKFRVIR